MNLNFSRVLCVWEFMKFMPLFWNWYANEVGPFTAIHELIIYLFLYLLFVAIEFLCGWIWLKFQQCEIPGRRSQIYKKKNDKWIKRPHLHIEIPIDGMRASLAGPLCKLVVELIIIDFNDWFIDGLFTFFLIYFLWKFAFESCVVIDWFFSPPAHLHRRPPHLHSELLWLARRLSITGDLSSIGSAPVPRAFQTMQMTNMQMMIIWINSIWFNWFGN